MPLELPYAHAHGSCLRSLLFSPLSDGSGGSSADILGSRDAAAGDNDNFSSCFHETPPGVPTHAIWL
jgi:hypothetical protein